ncbi:hypothetical protein [Pseudomonas pseudonitroreducens]|uniref:hypothetical protein n=1 Tax=Pseudomonas pseudonitroreducens TaxID=2892326 RepID=UPI001F332C06|nr:hypothetical protein [Pseudomonas pseudonitroreducens]
MTYTISIEQYELTVEITDYSPGRAGKYSGPWEDCYPDEPEELEFEVVSGLVYDEDNNVEDLGANGCAALAEKYAEFIEEELWLQVDDERDDSDYDRGDDRAWEAA